MFLNIKHLNIRSVLILLAFIFLTFNNTIVFAQDNKPEFPYDPEEKATQTKICAKVCLKRRDACIKIEGANPEFEQICQSQMIICINQCR